jgi:hypothetical protein
VCIDPEVLDYFEQRMRQAVVGHAYTLGRMRAWGGPRARMALA